MIDKKELRVGNTILARVSFFEGSPDYNKFEKQVVESIVDSGINEYRGDCDYYYKDLFGIELTPEILQKTNLIKQSIDDFPFPTWEDKMGWRLSFDGGIYKLWTGDMHAESIKIETLHKLQNAYFILTGEELIYEEKQETTA